MKQKVLALSFNLEVVNLFMTQFKFFTLILPIFLFFQTNYGEEKEIVIPFQLTANNNLVVQVILNEKESVKLMFHTAANSVSLTEAATQNLKTIKFTSTADGVKSWGGGENSSRISPNNILRIGETKWTGISIFENKQSGQGTDGKFGIDLFKDKVIELDFDSKVIKITSTLPDKIKKFERRKLVFKDEMMFLEAECLIGQNIFKNRFLIHSGYSGGILFDDKFANENKLDKKLKAIDEKELTDSFGNVLKTKRAILPGFRVGKEKLSEVTASFFTGELGGQKISLIGAEVLKRFNLIIDAKREFIYLKRNKFFNSHLVLL